MRAMRLLGVIGLVLGSAFAGAAPAEAASGPWVQTAAGETHTCAINSAGSLYCWGANGSGQAGDGTANSPRLTLYRVGAAGVWASVAAGYRHTCGITKAKNLYCWGHNSAGQTGDGTNTDPRLTLNRVGAAGVWASVAAGGDHTCAITTARNLYCWGRNASGETGDHTQTTPRLTLNRVGAAGVWTKVEAGNFHTFGLTTAKNLYCWGYNQNGQIGDGTNDDPRLDLYRVGAAGVWAGVTAGGYHTCGVTTAKNLYCWGYNLYGQVGDGTTDTPRLSLHRVGAAGAWSSVAGGYDHTCGITTAKNLYCWGYNNFGQVGDGTLNTPRLSLYRVSVAGVWAQVTAGDYHACAITTAKELFCWGDNDAGQIGTGAASAPRTSPFRVD